MGAVWIDQLVAWKNEGRMDASITPVLPAPGLPIYPLYLVVPREAANREAAVRYFLVDTHGILNADHHPAFGVYAVLDGASPLADVSNNMLVATKLRQKSHLHIRPMALERPHTAQPLPADQCPVVWHKPDVPLVVRNVRFLGNSRHRAVRRRRIL
jgi:hypothetical protein